MNKILKVETATTDIPIENNVTIADIKPASQLSWKISLDPGTYVAELEIACHRHLCGSLYEFSLGKQVVRGEVPRIENMQTFMLVRLGTFDFNAAVDNCSLKVLACSGTFGHIKAIHLQPASQVPKVTLRSANLHDADFQNGHFNRSLWQEDFVASPLKKVEVLVDPEQRYQKILGLGGTFNEQGGDVLFSLPEEKQNEVLNNLFDSDQAGMSCCCLPIGASDFALAPYSLDDSSDDYEMKEFSVSRDEQLLVPYIRAAQSINPELIFHARPWSPPAWMKTGGEMGRGSLIDSPEMYKAHALYLCTFVEKMAELGISIERLVVQNEPDVAGGYAGCIYSPEEYAKFFTEYLKPMADERGLDTELWAGSFQGIWKATAQRVMAQPGMREAVAGVAFQYNMYDNVMDFRLKYPQIPIMHTESPCHNGANSEDEALAFYHDVLRYLNMGATTYTYWNMILDSHQASHTGWRQNSMIIIDKLTGNVKYNPEFYVMKLLSQGIQPGAERIETFCFERLACAFQNRDGSIVCFLENPEDKIITGYIHCDGRIYPQELPAKSVVSITIKI